jgi:hypothetical protein
MSRPKEQHAFGSTQVEFDPAQVRNGQYGAAKTMSVPDLVLVLDEILSASKSSGLNPDNLAHKEQFKKLYHKLFNDFREFARELPVMFRWTVFTQKSSRQAFEHYFKHYHRPMWKDRREMLTAQAEYLVRMFILDRSRNSSANMVAQYRTNTVKMLLEEDKQYEAAAAEAQELAKEQDELQIKLEKERLVAAVAEYVRRHSTETPAETSAETPAEPNAG